MKKGFTIVEVLIVVVIVAILATIVVVAVNGRGEETPQSEQEYCEWYEDTTYKNIPAKCVKYYQGGSL